MVIDMEKKKVGLCMAYTGTNYGQLLQAFATQYMIEKLGFETEILEYRKTVTDRIPSSIGEIAGLVKIMIRVVREKSADVEESDSIHRKNKEERQNAADWFRKNYLHGFVSCKGYNALTQHSKELFAVVVGSDQLWLPEVSFNEFYTLRFAAPGVRRVSYATSLGVTNYPEYCKKAARDYWRKIDYLSVREEQGKKLINDICEVPVKVVVDPTYLISRNEWLEIIPQKDIVKKGYVLCYFLGDNIEAKEKAVEYATNKGLRTVSILSDECDANDDIMSEIVTGKTATDFINLIRNADCIFTDSFHGLAFSVINEKQFFVSYRIRKGEKQSRNSRIDNILRMWGLENRLMEGKDYCCLNEDEIDYLEVRKILDEYRKDSMLFLERALGKNEKREDRS